MKKLVILSFMIASNTFAAYRLEDAPAMIAEQIEKEVMNTNEAFKNVSTDTEEESIQSWVLSRIRLQIKPFAEFDAKLAAVKVAPMLEFRWERKAPKGWRTYKPASDNETNGH
jgi:hypothetical protein